MKKLLFMLTILAFCMQVDAHPGFGRVHYGRGYYEKPHYTKPHYSNPNRYAYVEVCPARPNVVVVRPLCPSPQYIWVDGDWIWNQQANQYIYGEGRWILPVAGAIWRPGHWKNTPYGWHWVNGHWKYV